MRVILGVIVLSFLCAGCERPGSGGASPGPDGMAGTPTPGASQRPDPLECGDQVVTVTFGLNADHASGVATCELLGVEPDNVPVCIDTEKITWKYVNDCEAHDVKVKIGKDRGQKYGKYKKDKVRDPLEGGGDFEDLKAVGAKKTVTVSANVKGKDDAPDGLYKYDLEGEGAQGKWNVDPEIDVRRTTRRFR